MDWLSARWESIRGTIAAGDVQTVERRYLPAAIAFGLVIGALLGLLWTGFAVIAVLAGGFALGYATRAYRSHRRRVEYIRQRGDLL